MVEAEGEEAAVAVVAVVVLVEEEEVVLDRQSTPDCAMWIG